MASPANRPCVLSRKRQHNLNDKYEVDDIVLSTSHLSTLNETIATTKKFKTSENSVCSENSTPDHSETESEGEDEQNDNENNVAVSATTAPEYENADVPAAEIIVCEEAPKSPQPGPSKYEDITFEPAVTSTPHHSQEDVEKLNESKEIDFQKEMRHARDFIAKIEEEFVEDFRIHVRKQTAKHVAKLKERRIKVSKAMANVKKDIKRLETMFTFLSNHKNDIDNALNKFNYLIDRYPY